MFNLIERLELMSRDLDKEITTLVSFQDRGKRSQRERLAREVEEAIEILEFWSWMKKRMGRHEL